VNVATVAPHTQETVLVQGLAVKGAPVGDLTITIPEPPAAPEVNAALPPPPPPVLADPAVPVPEFAPAPPPPAPPAPAVVPLDPPPPPPAEVPAGR